MRGHWPNDRVDNQAKPMKWNELFLESAIREEICACSAPSFPTPRSGHTVTTCRERLIREAISILSSALLRPCLAVEALRTALRESDIPIFVDVHDWALLPEASQKEIAARFLPLR